MAETISKHIGEGFGKGELFAALSYDASDSFGGMKIKNVMFNSTGKAYFLDANAYIYASSSGVLELTATTINLNGALGIGSTTALTTATTAMSAVKVQSAFSATTGYHVGAWFVGNYTGAGAAGGSVYALRGHVAVTGTQTTVGAEAFIVGVHGRCAVTGTAYNSSAVYAGVLAQMLGGGTWTAANKVYALWVDNQLATNPTAGTVAMVGIRQNNNVSTAVVDHCFDIYGPRIANFINFDTCTGSGAFISNSAATGSVKKVKCKIGDTDYYINMYELS